MIPTAAFGQTGHGSSRLIFGACAFSDCTQAEADPVLELLLEHGINHIDTAADYQLSEQRLGPWMKHHRDRFFLATKTAKRTRREAREELYRSLDLLQTDHIDLWQMHCLIEPDEWETAMSADGALESFIEARDEGLVKHIGITGHGVHAPAMHLKSLDRFEFESVLLPLNYAQMQNTVYAADFEKLSATCHTNHVAMQTIKSISRSLLEKETQRYNMWYAPLDDQQAINHAVHWVLGNPQVFLNTPADISLLPKVIQAAEAFRERPTDETMKTDQQTFGIKPLFT